MYRIWPDYRKITREQQLAELKTVLKGWGLDLPQDWALSLALDHAKGDYITAAHAVAKEVES